ncbi:MAG: NAD(+) diphosphatase [Eubacteriales bacterium]|nr:NAD(+) diphosphatase [Eubacteriales bacterium]
MIQDIFPHKLNNHYDPDAVPNADSIILCFTEEGILCKLPLETDAEGTEKEGADTGKTEDAFLLPRLQEITDSGVTTAGDDFLYLFSMDRTGYFLFRNENIPNLHGFKIHSLRALREKASVPVHLMFALYTGRQLAAWYRNNRYCGRCGALTAPDAKERAIRCQACGQLVYPRINPAVIVGVTHEDRLLLTKYRTGFPHYALVAGFTEIGETLEETVAREVMEETGLKVKNIRYYKSQPWGIADDLLAGFYCEADGSTEICMDSSELKLAEWKRREEIELQPDDYSLTNEMMRRFKEGLG